MIRPEDIRVGFALETHPGQLRPHNEDALCADPAAGLFVLADGLGGYNAGEIASTMAVSTLLSQLPSEHQKARVDGQAFDPEFLALVRDRAERLSLNEGEAKTLELRLRP